MIWMGGINSSLRSTGFHAPEAIEEALSSKLSTAMFLIHLRATKLPVILSWLSDDGYRFCVEPTVMRIVTGKLFETNPEILRKYWRDFHMIPLSFDAGDDFHEWLIRIIPYLSAHGTVFVDQLVYSDLYEFDGKSSKFNLVREGNLPEGVKIYPNSVASTKEKSARRAARLLN